jgi:hypothetical protein
VVVVVVHDDKTNVAGDEPSLSLLSLSPGFTRSVNHDGSAGAVSGFVARCGFAAAGGEAAWGWWGSGGGG